MKLSSPGSLLLLVVAVLGGCAPTNQQHETATNVRHPTDVQAADALVQYSLIAALADGDYADGASLRQVLRDGDFGIGTFDRLDGEMIVLDGKMYQATGDGAVRPADLESSTPFAAVTFFEEDGRLEHVQAATLEDLDEQLDRKLPRRNSPYAIRLDGQFKNLTLRSVPAQTPPFQPLVNVVKHQSVWEHRDLRGTLVGFRCPAWIGTLNVAGYHWHFLSDDHQVGGHVLACQFDGGALRYDECTSVLIRLPATSEFDEFDAAKIKNQDINKIERQRE